MTAAPHRDECALQPDVNAAIAELAGVLISQATIEELSNLVLERAKELTTSAIGYVGHIDRETGKLVSVTLTRSVWEDCQVADKRVIFDKFYGLWGAVLQQRQSLLTNQPTEHPASGGVPEGHLPIRRFLSAPAMHGPELMGQIALANAERDYTSQDLALVERLAGLYAVAVSRRRAEADLERMNRELEARVAERTRQLEHSNAQLRSEIARRQQATEALGASERRLRQIFETTREGILVCSLGGAVEVANPSAAWMLGFASPDELVGRSFEELYSGALDPEPLGGRLWTDGHLDMELRTHRQDGSPLYVMTSATLQRDRAGEPQKVLAVVRDISERRKKEEELERNYQTQAVLARLLNLAAEQLPLDQLLGQALDSILATPWLGLEPRGSIFLVEHDPEELVLRVHRGMPEGLLESCCAVPFGHCLCGRAARRGSVIFADCIGDDHEEHSPEIEDHGHYCVPVRLAERTLGVICLYLQLGRERVQEEVDYLKAIADALAGIIVRRRAEQQLRSLASQLSLAEERERRRIADDLHDHIIQDLAQVKIGLAALRAIDSCSETVATMVEGIRDKLDRTIAETRALTAELSPPMLYELGLEPTLEWLLEDLRQRLGLAGTFRDDGAPKPVDDDTRVLVFHSVRELLANVAKHARATSVNVTVARDGEHIQVEVEDDGIGLEASRGPYLGKRPAGLGLFGVRERMARLDGRLELRDRPGGGTVATLVAPLSDPDTFC